MTIQDIAKQAGVSISTVSRVINHSSKVAPETAKRVMETIQKNGFVPYQNALVLKSQRTSKVLILIPQLSNPFFTLVTNSLSNTLYASNYTPVVGVTDYVNDYGARFIAMLENHEVDGVVMFYEGQNNEFLEQISGHFPCVCVGKRLDHMKVSYVSIDDTKAAYDATEYLLRQGHTRIGLIGGYGAFAQAREEGYLAAMADYGIPMQPEYIQRAEVRFRGGFDYDGGIFALQKMLVLPQPPTALLVLYDTHALGVIKYCLSKNIVPGKDISIIGFDNNPVCRIYHPSISSISQPYFDIGNASAKVLLEQITTQDLAPKSVVLPHELILRDSSCYQGRPLR